MDFDIDAVLDQLEKSIIASNTEDSSTNLIVEVPATLTPTKTVDELLLLDLDPVGFTDNHQNDQQAENKLERLKHDLQQLYASSTIVELPPAPSSVPVLPDVVTQQEELSTTPLPLAVEQLELQVCEQILQHTNEQNSSPTLLPDLTTVLAAHHENDEDTSSLSTSSSSVDEEEISSPSIINTIELSNNTILPSEPDLLQHETPPTQASILLHSVDSIVNATTPMVFQDFVPPNPAPLSQLIEIEPVDLISEPVFTACDYEEDDSAESLQLQSEELEPNAAAAAAPPLPPSLTTSTQEFDLVKNVLSEIFDQPDEELIDENLIREQKDTQEEPAIVDAEHQVVPPPSSSDVDIEDDFRFLDEMLSSIDVSDTDIHQLTPAEIDRVDSLLKQIVDEHQAQAVPPPVDEEELSTPPPPRSPSPPIESSLPPPPLAAAAAAAAAPVTPVDEELARVEQEWSRLTEAEKTLGSIAPEWVSDDHAPACMKCAAKFSLTRRRHHCRACGKVFCTSCCSQKVKLIYDDSKEDRACNDCIKTINRVEHLWTYMRHHQKPRSSVLRKKDGSSFAASSSGNGSGVRGAEHKKSVTFDDGVKPGVESGAAAIAVAATNIMSSNKMRTSDIPVTEQAALFKPEILSTNEAEERMRRLQDPDEPPVELRIHANLIVLAKLVDDFHCHLNRDNPRCWLFFTRGLCTVAQDELVFVFDQNATTVDTLITDLLIHIHQIYMDATRGSFIRHLGLSFSSNTSSFLGTSNAAGFLYITDYSSTYRLLPEAPFLFGILVHPLELPTAQCFPLRLLIRLGYEYQSYPWPLFSVINRDPMFSDTQNTIMSLLCDFRSFTYALPTVRGLILSLGAQGSVSVRIPRNRHDDILKALQQSSPHALSFGLMNVNRQVHYKHLVTIQNSLDQQYETRLFVSSFAGENPERTMIGASFIVINASLRSRDSPSNSPSESSGSFSSNTGPNAKTNPIEDGVMLQIDGDILKILKQCLKERKDYAILAKAKPPIVDELMDPTMKRTSTEQLVEFLWIDDDNDVNRGVRSPIDHFPMDGIRNSRIHYAGQRSSFTRLRWTDLFFIDCHFNNNESFDPTRLADSLAKAFIQALLPFVDMLVEARCRKLGLRVTIDRENASYLAGSNGEQLSAFFLSQLDDHMIPIVMKASDNVSRTAPALVLELVFYLLD